VDRRLRRPRGRRARRARGERSSARNSSPLADGRPPMPLSGSPSWKRSGQPVGVGEQLCEGGPDRVAGRGRAIRRPRSRRARRRRSHARQRCRAGTRRRARGESTDRPFGARSVPRTRLDPAGRAARPGPERAFARALVERETTAARSTSGNSCWRPRARRPLHGEGVAAHGRRVEVAPHRPRADLLAGLLHHRAELDERPAPRGRVPVLLLELAQRAHHRIVAGLVLALGG